jgi:4-diphosphocytidyl-2-C-methyl-D-erythritol kinase
MTRAGWPAPAKLNLFLHITGRRPDGYHLLQSVFQFLDVHDTLHFEPRTDDAVRRLTELSGVPAEKDLTVRAAFLLKEITGYEGGVDIRLDKRLPMGGGLGGGSSDAATALVALNLLWDLGLSVESLATLGLRLGADVPVFVRGRAAWAEGVGEVLTPVEGLPEPWYVVLTPPVTIATADVFGNAELTRNCPAITIRDFLQGHGTNVCEPVVRRRYPVVAEALDWLALHGAARLTGTGACLFAAFDSESQAKEVFEQRPRAFAGFVARGRNRSPLLDRLGA